jgi:hypothetical protein
VLQQCNERQAKHRWDRYDQLTERAAEISQVGESTDSWVGHRPPKLPEQSSGLADGMSGDGAGYLVVTFYNSASVGGQGEPWIRICMNHFGSRVLDLGDVE